MARNPERSKRNLQIAERLHDAVHVDPWGLSGEKPMTKTDDPKKPARPRTPRTDADKIAEAVDVVRKIAYGAFMADDKAKTDRCKAAISALLAIETPAEAQGRV